MKIKINGREEELTQKKSLFEVISDKGLIPDHVVVEHNSRIVPKEEWRKTTLTENDNIEIVSFVGGG